MRVLLIGADNYIGRRVFAALTATDWAQPFVASAPINATSLAPLFATADAVINCTIGAANQIIGVARTLFSVTAEATKSPRVVHLSSMTVYGSATGLIDEHAPLCGDLGAYSAAQVAADRLAAGYATTVRLRPGCEYGPDCVQWSERVARWLIARRLGDLGKNGAGFCNLLYVDDLVAAILAALTRPGVEGKAFNLSIGSQPTWNEYFERYAEALGVLPVRRVSPARLRCETMLLAPPLKIAELVLRKAGVSLEFLPSAIPPSLLNSCRQAIRLNVTTAEVDLGLRWTPLADGLRNAAAVFRDRV